MANCSGRLHNCFKLFYTVSENKIHIKLLKCPEAVRQSVTDRFTN